MAAHCPKGRRFKSCRRQGFWHLFLLAKRPYRPNISAIIACEGGNTQGGRRDTVWGAVLGLFPGGSSVGGLYQRSRRGLSRAGQLCCTETHPAAALCAARNRTRTPPKWARDTLNSLVRHRLKNTPNRTQSNRATSAAGTSARRPVVSAGAPGAAPGAGRRPAQPANYSGVPTRA